MTPPAAVSWAARLRWLRLENTPLAFLGLAATPYILSLFAMAELINDKLPKTPSRKTLAPFTVRIATGHSLELRSAPQAGLCAGRRGWDARGLRVAQEAGKGNGREGSPDCSS